MQFLYFLPGETAANKGILEQFGIADRLPTFSFRGPQILAQKGGMLCKNGTEGAVEIRGVLVGMCGAEDLKCDFSAQNWELVDDLRRPAWYLGWYVDRPPSEADLSRVRLSPGYPVEMGNGERWIIPPARRYPEGTSLPSTFKLAADGTERREIVKAYEDLFDALRPYAESYYAAAMRKDKSAPGEDLPDLPLAICYDLLGVNYRIGRPEINVLGLVTDSSRVSILLAAIDWWGFLKIAAEEATQPDPTVRLTAPVVSSDVVSGSPGEAAE
jgi:hypothetical protein